MSTKQTIMVPVEVTIFDDSDSCIPGWHRSIGEVTSDTVEDVLYCEPMPTLWAVTLKDRSVNHGYAMSINILPGIIAAVEELVPDKTPVV